MTRERESAKKMLGAHRGGRLFGYTEFFSRLAFFSPGASAMCGGWGWSVS